jgi:hypothetical protein
MATDEILRLHYYERQYLGASDLEDQQTYLRDMRRRHNVAHHVWGIVTGLDLVEVPVAGDPTAVDVFIQPGMAIDGFGREIIVLAPSKLDPALFASFADDDYRTFWISYNQQFAQQPAAGFAQCNVSNQYGRIEETFAFQVDPKPPTHDDVTVDGQQVNPTSTNISIPADDSIPYQELPDDTTDPVWLVQLGSVHWDGTAGQQKFKPASPQSRLSIGRAYVGAVAQTIYGPAPEPVVDPSNPDPSTALARFFVQPRFLPADPDAAGFAEVVGRLQVDGRIIAMKDVFLFGTKLRLQDTTGQDGGVPLWLQRTTGAGGTGFDLRVHIGDKPDAGNRLSVGTGPAGGAAEKVTFDVKGDDTVDIPTGMLNFGQTVRQMINLWQAKYGIGVQASDLYMRSDSDFFWFKSGSPSPNHGDPGGGTVLMSLTGGGNLYVENNVGIGTTVPEAQLHITGGQWDLTNSEGDLKIGNDTYRLKMGVALGGGGAGDVRVRAQGGTSRLILGSGNVDTLVVQKSSVGLGTLTPQKMLSVNGGMNIDQANVNSGALEPGLTFGDSSGEGIASRRFAGGNQAGLDFYTRFVPRLSITNLGFVGIGTTAPDDLLDVRGNIKLGAAGDLFALGAEENMRLLRGNVNADGSIGGGIGFTVNHTARGNYLIQFNAGFSSRPSASVTQVFPSASDFGPGGDTRDNCVIDGLSAVQMKVVTGDNLGDHEDRAFTFIVVGTR